MSGYEDRGKIPATPLRPEGGGVHPNPPALARVATKVSEVSFFPFPLGQLQKGKLTTDQAKNPRIKK